MNLDDETLLTAYLDGELDAAGRNWVEAATQASPGLARRLRDLAEARDLVEGLSRPAPLFDVSAAVLARIAAPPRPWAFRVRVSRVVSPRWLAVGSGLAAAASLLITLSLTQIGPGAQVRKNGLDGRLAVSDRKPPSPPSHSIAAPSPPHQTNPTAPIPTGHNERLATVPGPAHDLGAESRLLQDQERLRGLLDRGDVRKIRLPVDRLGEDERRKLELAIEQTARKNPAKGQITVAPGIIIDRLAAQGAIVYALLLDEDELNHLQRNLVDQFGPIDQPSTAPPAEVLQLADQRHVSFSVPYGTLTSPPRDVHDRQMGIGIHQGERISPTNMNDGGASLPDQFTVLPRRARPVGPPADAVKSTPAPAPDSGKLATILIWLVPRQASPTGGGPK